MFLSVQSIVPLWFPMAIFYWNLCFLFKKNSFLFNAYKHCKDYFYFLDSNKIFASIKIYTLACGEDLITRLSHSICWRKPAAFTLVIPISSTVFVLRRHSTNSYWMNELFHIFPEIILSHSPCPLNEFKSYLSIF